MKLNDSFICFYIVRLLLYLFQSSFRLFCTHLSVCFSSKPVSPSLSPPSLSPHLPSLILNMAYVRSFIILFVFLRNQLWVYLSLIFFVSLKLHLYYNHFLSFDLFSCPFLIGLNEYKATFIKKKKRTLELKAFDTNISSEYNF